MKSSPVTSLTKKYILLLLTLAFITPEATTLGSSRLSHIAESTLVLSQKMHQTLQKMKEEGLKKSDHQKLEKLVLQTQEQMIATLKKFQEQYKLDDISSQVAQESEEIHTIIDSLASMQQQLTTVTCNLNELTGVVVNDEENTQQVVTQINEALKALNQSIDDKNNSNRKAIKSFQKCLTEMQEAYRQDTKIEPEVISNIAQSVTNLQRQVEMFLASPKNHNEHNVDEIAKLASQFKKQLKILDSLLGDNILIKLDSLLKGITGLQKTVNELSTLLPPDLVNMVNGLTSQLGVVQVGVLNNTDLLKAATNTLSQVKSLVQKDLANALPLADLNRLTDSVTLVQSTLTNLLERIPSIEETQQLVALIAALEEHIRSMSEVILTENNPLMKSISDQLALLTLREKKTSQTVKILADLKEHTKSLLTALLSNDLLPKLDTLLSNLNNLQTTINSLTQIVSPDLLGELKGIIPELGILQNAVGLNKNILESLNASTITNFASLTGNLANISSLLETLSAILPQLDLLQNAVAGNKNAIDDNKELIQSLISFTSGLTGNIANLSDLLAALSDILPQLNLLQDVVNDSKNGIIANGLSLASLTSSVANLSDVVATLTALLPQLNTLQDVVAGNTNGIVANGLSLETLTGNLASLSGVVNTLTALLPQLELLQNVVNDNKNGIVANGLNLQTLTSSVANLSDVVATLTALLPQLNLLQDVVAGNKVAIDSNKDLIQSLTGTTSQQLNTLKDTVLRNTGLLESLFSVVAQLQTVLQTLLNQLPLNGLNTATGELNALVLPTLPSLQLPVLPAIPGLADLENILATIGNIQATLNSLIQHLPTIASIPGALSGLEQQVHNVTQETIAANAPTFQALNDQLNLLATKVDTLLAQDPLSTDPQSEIDALTATLNNLIQIVEGLVQNNQNLLNSQFDALSQIIPLLPTKDTQKMLKNVETSTKQIKEMMENLVKSSAIKPRTIDELEESPILMQMFHMIKTMSEKSKPAYEEMKTLLQALAMERTVREKEMKKLNKEMAAMRTTLTTLEKRMQ